MISLNNSFVSNSASIGKNVYIGVNCIIEDNVVISDESYIDSNTIIRKGTQLGEHSFVGSNCIIGEYDMSFIQNRKQYSAELMIGNEAVIRSGTIIYSGSIIGNNFNTGHRVTIREKSVLGDNVSVGTLSDIQGNCTIGSYVRMHSNVHIGQLSKIDSFTWIYPYVVLTNDPTPPSDKFVGVHVKSFAVIATGSIILPGIEIGQDSLVAAGAIVTKDVADYSVVGGNPAHVISDVRKIKSHFDGNNVYPWREHFDTYMPWAGFGYDKWFDSLSVEEKKNYGII